MVFRSSQLERNELFLPGRMAYVVDLDDEFTDTDIPTTLIRSKADCPSMEVRVSVRPPDGPQLLLSWSAVQWELLSIGVIDCHHLCCLRLRRL